MNCGENTLHPKSFTRHLLARNHKKKSYKRAVVVGLMLTSMVDMFSLLVIFLLQTFAASPELLIVTKGVTLPTAITGRELKDAPVLSISNEGIFLDQKLVGKTDVLLKKPEPLIEKLDALRELWQKTHPGATFVGEINLQAHRDIASSVVSQVMGMLPSSHYGSIQLAVYGGASSE